MISLAKKVEVGCVFQGVVFHCPLDLDATNSNSIKENILFLKKDFDGSQTAKISPIVFEMYLQMK